MKNYNFLAVGLFYVVDTNEVYYMSVKLNNHSNRYPEDNVDDILTLIDIINNGTIEYPLNAICIDIDAVANMSGDILWSHTGEVSYHNGVQICELIDDQWVMYLYEKIFKII